MAASSGSSGSAGAGGFLRPPVLGLCSIIGGPLWLRLRPLVPRSPFAFGERRAGMLESWVVASCSSSGRVAQLVRAPRLHRGGPGFESLRAHHSKPSFLASTAVTV